MSTKDFVQYMNDTDRVVVTEHGFAYYYTLTKEWVEKLKADPNLATDVEIAKILLVQEGKHIVFIAVYGERMSAIREGIRKVIKEKKPASISWLSKDLRKFTYREV